MIPSEIQWRVHNPDQTSVYDGDIYLVAIKVTNNKTKKTFWEIEKVRVACDWDGESGFFDLIYADSEESELYDAWAWQDFEYSIKIQD